MDDLEALAAKFGAKQIGAGTDDLEKMAATYGAKPVGPSADDVRAAMLLRTPAAGGMFGQFAPDVAAGIAQTLGAGAQILSHATGIGVPQVDSANKAIKDFYQSKFQPQAFSGSTLAQGVGQALPTAALLPATAATIPGSIAQGAALGGLAGALTPVDQPADNFWTQKAKQVGGGALAGGVVNPVATLATRAIAPQINPAAQTMLDAGVTPTPGQIIGGTAKSLEDRATSQPFIGDAIKAGQTRALDDFNRAVYARTLAPLGPQAEAYAATLPVGREGIQKVGDRLSDAYDSVLPSIGVQLDDAFKARVASLSDMTQVLPEPMQKQFSGIVQSQVIDKATPYGLMNGETMKQVESKLGQLANGYRSSSDFDQRQMGSAIRELQATLRTTVAEQNPQLAPIVQDVNKGWANLTQLENAGSMLGAKEGKFTPSQYLNAVKRSDSSVRDRAFARGEALNQGFAQAADQTLSSRYPDSGTSGRQLLADAMRNPVGFLGSAAYSAIPSLAYSGPGQAAMAALLGRRPQGAAGIRSLLEPAVPYLPFPAAAGLLGGS